MRRIAAALLSGLLAAAATVALPASPASAASVRIMPVGDSITEGANGDATYRYFLWHDLIDAGYAVDFVGNFTGVGSGAPKYPDFDQNHSARSGWKANSIADKIAAWTTRNRPDIILLHIGTNDIRQGWSNASTQTDIENIITRARGAKANVKFVLAQLIPHEGLIPQVEDLNQRIANVAAAMTTSTSPITLVDQYSGFSTAADTKDGVHPNESGDQKMAARWFPALQTILGGGAPVGPTISQGPADQTVTEGETATFSVTASGTAPLGYQWRRDGAPIPGADSASYTTPPVSLADDGATFDVVVSNGVGDATSAAATLTVALVGSTTSALLVVGDAVNLVTNDRVVRDRLATIVDEVVVIDDGVVNGAGGNDLVAISSTASQLVGPQFRSATVPVVTWEHLVYDDLGLTDGVSGTHYGALGSQTQVNVVASGHPVAGGLAAGPATIVTSGRTFGWGVPAPSADVVAVMSTAPSRAAVFAYEAGDPMFGVTAPARRVALPNQAPAGNNAAGWALFDAAVGWALGS